MNQTLENLPQLIKNGYPNFGIFKKVNQINYLDYHSYLLNGKSIGQFKKKMKANQFVFIQIILPKTNQQPAYRICFAIGTIKWATTAFCYIFNDENQQCFTIEALQPLLHHCQFNQSTYQDSIHFYHTKLTIDITFQPSQLTVKIDNPLFILDTNLPRLSDDNHQPLAICTPTGKTGWTYTQKEPFANVSGQLTFKQSHQNFAVAPETLHFQQAIASLDWSLGYMRRITNWFWCSINHILADKRQFAMNLAMGVNETGFCENACWLDGKIYYLPPVMFQRPPNNRNQPWQIYLTNLGWSNVGLNLTFTPIRCYQKNDRFYLVDSIFEQWLGIYQGTIQLENETIYLDQVIGLAEDHYAKW